jgi:hypothetical protein
VISPVNRARLVAQSEEVLLRRQALINAKGWTMKLDRTISGIFLDNSAIEIRDPQTHRRPFDGYSQS